MLTINIWTQLKIKNVQISNLPERRWADVLAEKTECFQNPHWHMHRQTYIIIMSYNSYRKCFVTNETVDYQYQYQLFF